ncbi:MAG: aldo/keto reductase [Candidatus Hodarchaeota archaeon]
MQTRTLGKSGIKVSPMGMGCWAIGGPFLHTDGSVLGYGHVRDEDSIQAIQKGLDMGITLFDTSDAYCCGRSERVLGKALKGRREEVIIATKFGWNWDMQSGNPSFPCRLAKEGSLTPEFIRESCKGSLERLQTDYIDLYLLHINRMDPEKAPEVMETLEELAEGGKIRYYGWSTDDPDRAKILAKGIHCAIVEFRHNFTSHNNRMIKEVMNDFNIAGLIHGPLGYGIFTGKYKDDSELPKDHMWHGTKFGEGRAAEIRAVLEEMCGILTSDGRTLAQAALGWIWAQHHQLVPIPGFKNVKQVEENAGAMEFGPLSKKQVEQVKKILSKIETPPGWVVRKTQE